MNPFRELIQRLWLTRGPLAAFFIHPGQFCHSETMDQQPLCSSNLPSIKLEGWFILFS